MAAELPSRLIHSPAGHHPVMHRMTPMIANDLRSRCGDESCAAGSPCLYHEAASRLDTLYVRGRAFAAMRPSEALAEIGRLVNAE